jgi:aspartyl-tRNA(Asn)/glutamyl-tRNA(Gln) amidotransferase subunit A
MHGRDDGQPSQSERSRNQKIPKSEDPEIRRSGDGDDLHNVAVLTIAGAAADLRSGRRRAVDLVDAALEAIAREQPRTNAFTAVHADAARKAAHTLDADLGRGLDRGPLHGIPISIKDLIDVAGEVTSAGSRVLRGRVAGADAPVVARLRQAGAIIIGRTNLHEFALGTTSDDSAFGPVRNPRDPSRSAGGSSGGSAAAVATGMGLASIGTDTGGSVRIPAAACGIVGLKPGYGEIPTAGVIPLSPSFDHVGPLALNVGDTAVLWTVLADRPEGVPLDAEIASLRLGVLRGYFATLVTPDVGDTFEQTLDRLRRAGATATDIEIASAPDVPDAYVRIVLPEGAHWHAVFLDTRAGDYSPTVLSRLRGGRDIAAVEYLAAQAFRERLRREVDAALEECDALVLPTLPIVAPPLGASEVPVSPDGARSIAVRTAMLRHTQPFNLTGHPAISIPLDTSGALPVGLQIVGRLGATPRLLAIAAACEKMIS